MRPFLSLVLSFSFLTSALALPTSQLPRTNDPVAGLTSSPSDVNHKSFDYIIVGGGTAGLVVAARLAEDTSKKVVVLEAGNSHLDDPLIVTPTAVGKVYGNAEYDWLYSTVPQQRADDRRLAFIRGKVLGGSSAINAMIWDRSSKAEYDNTAKLGNPGWDWNGLFPYMKKSENFVEPDPTLAAAWNQTFDRESRGKGGPISTVFPNYLPDAEFPQHPAALELGIPIVHEPMGGEIVGSWKGETSIDFNNRTRSYSVNYLAAAQASGRNNLLVLTGVHVTKINWDNAHIPRGGNSTTASHLENGAIEPRTASGVEFVVNGTTYNVAASREVILSAGSIGSPALLELSGVGDKKRLEKIGIQSVLQLPGVGENMQEHIFVTQSYVVQNGISTLDALRDNQTFFTEQALLWQQRPAQGALGYGATGISMLGLRTFVPSWSSLLQRAKLQISSRPRSSGQKLQQSFQLAFLRDPKSSAVEVLTEGVHGTPEQADPTKRYVSFLTLLQQPFSRGSTHISSKDPNVKPNIDPNYFDVDFDLKVLVSIAKWVRSTWTQTKAFAGIVVSPDFPSANVETDAQWESWVKQNFQSQGHTTGTCSMMAKAAGGVVDPTLKVWGTSNVRVVDLSVMPQQFTGHPQALAYTIAEKAADLIKASHR